MKILFILDLYAPHIWWVEILFENIITGLEKNGVHCIILTSRYDTKLASYEKISENREIYRVGHNRYDFMFYSLFLGYKLAKISDIIHTTTYNSAIPASIIWLLSWKKVILTVHEIFGKLWYRFMGWKWFFFKLFENMIFLFPFEKYICVSDYTKNSLRVHFWVSDQKLLTIYNGIDYSFWKRENFSDIKVQEIRKALNIEHSFVGLFYGRAWVSKWLEYYIQAIPKIVSEVPNFKALLIVPHSSNNPITKINELIHHLNIEKHVILIPGVWNKELPYYILGSSFVIIPSLAEWFWFAVAEVSALNHPLITSQVAAIPEVASGKINFVEPWNIEDIITGVIKCKNNIYENIVKKEFTWEKNIDHTLQIYKKIVWK